jgi:hypothetical protein
MPQGKGTYGNQVGRPAKKKLMIGKEKTTPTKKKKAKM